LNDDDGGDDDGGGGGDGSGDDANDSSHQPLSSSSSATAVLVPSTVEPSSAQAALLGDVPVSTSFPSSLSLSVDSSSDPVPQWKLRFKPDFVPCTMFRRISRNRTTKQ
jgi:hypothetical protein